MKRTTDSPSIFDIPDFVYSSEEDWTSGGISYSATVDGNNLPYNGISLSGQTISITITDNTYVGTYNVEISAYESSYGSTTTETLELEITELVPSFNLDQDFTGNSYTIAQAAKEIPFDFYAANYDGAFTLSYSLEWITDPGYTLASKGISLDSTNKKILVETSDTTDEGTHAVKFTVTGTYNLGSLV